MTPTTLAPAPLIARNPSTGAELARLAPTPPEAVAALVDRARAAQEGWARTSWDERRDALQRWWRALARDADRWADALRDEVGKPRAEAMGEVVSSLDAIRWIVRHGGRALADARIGPGWQRFFLIPAARLRWQPLGVVGMIGTWNYPLLLNAPAIAAALAAGNGVVWKPSELAPLTGQMLQESLDEGAGLPAGLVAAATGAGDVGRALTESAIDKGVFTGGVENGRRVLAALAARGIPAVAELSGFDPAIVLADAPVDPTARALAWSAFVGAGQTCVAIKRVYVVGDWNPWLDRLAELAQSIRVGNPGGGHVDMGPLISEAARERFDGYIQAAIAAGARVLSGGRPIPGPGWFYAPTVLAADGPAPEEALAGCFGPAIVVRGVPDADSAIAAANASRFGLAASVWGRDRGRARAIAARLQAGMVTINDAVTPTASASAPFGGTRASGHGRVRGVLGLREFAQPQAVTERPLAGLRPQLFPYDGRSERAMAIYRRLFHPR